ncbi:class I SAM-dependent methyltransferase [Acinetobacter colistiniresistens]|uniref:class I SAM-dependent methyltransferase n=1 Tax=Acinetobacter colistiniresistens TaxID=280145 RepID=UPI0012509723|nr:class I SAM-dependent methyltransferase [Acinetobacter colistiniresistens]
MDLPVTAENSTDPTVLTTPLPEAQQPSDFAFGSIDQPIEYVKQHVKLTRNIYTKLGASGIEQYKAGFAELKANEAALIASLTKNLKNSELKDLIGIMTYAFHMPTKKEDLVKKAYSALLDQYATTGISYSPFSESYSDALERHVNAVTGEKLDKLKQEYDQRKAKEEQTKIAISNPQSLKDFNDYLYEQTRTLGKTFNEAYMSLDANQRELYDNLSAEESLKKRSEEKTQTKDPSYSGEVVNAEVIAGKHTKYEHDIWTVQLSDRLSKDDYYNANSNAKKLGGYYSRYTGNGAIAGFVFKSEESANAFAKLVGGDSSAAQDVAKTQADVMQDDKTQTTVERLRAMSENLTDKANESLNRDRLVNTHRRAGMAARAEREANTQLALADTMKRIADNIEAGQVKFLGGIRAKSHVVQLESLLNAGSYYQWLYIKKHNPQDPVLKNSTGADYPISKDTASYVKFPEFSLYISHWLDLARELDNLKGGESKAKILRRQFSENPAYMDWLVDNFNRVAIADPENPTTARIIKGKIADVESAIKRSGKQETIQAYKIKNGQYALVLTPQEAKKRSIWDGQGDKLVPLKADFVNEIIQVFKNNGKDIPWQLERDKATKDRLDAMGIQTPRELRAAIREYVSMREEPKGEDEIKQLERAMVGRQNDGLDFFPTPGNTVRDMLTMANLKEGDSVLEPSAGMGHIAEIIRETGVEPDVIEYSAGRRELLEKKGFNVVGQDFLEFKGEYDKIIMNPPFSNRQDAAHVKHAYSLLKSGGTLVSVMGEGVFFGQDKAAEDFRKWLDSVGGESEQLEAGTFNDKSLPVQTGANTRIVIIHK